MTTQGRGQATRGGQINRREVSGNNRYVQGSTVRKVKTAPAIHEVERRQISSRTRKNRENLNSIHLGSVLFLFAALCVTAYILLGYLSIQSDITNSVKNISKLESQLNDLKLANDEEYSRITSSIDLDEIKRIAIQEMGMTYAKEGQIIQFSGEESDYVRQNAKIPE